MCYMFRPNNMLNMLKWSLEGFHRSGLSGMLFSDSQLPHMHSWSNTDLVLLLWSPQQVLSIESYHLHSVSWEYLRQRCRQCLWYLWECYHWVRCLYCQNWWHQLYLMWFRGFTVAISFFQAMRIMLRSYSWMFQLCAGSWSFLHAMHPL